MISLCRPPPLEIQEDFHCLNQGLFHTVLHLFSSYWSRSHRGLRKYLSSSQWLPVPSSNTSLVGQGVTEGSNLAWNLPKHPQDSPALYLLSTVIIFHNFLTFSFSEGHTQSGHRRWCVNRSHLTQSRWKPLENLWWQETSRIWISPEVQTDPGAEWLLAGSVLCTFVTVRPRDWLTIASEFKTEVLADVPRWLLGTERPDVSCPGPNSHRHSRALSSLFQLSSKMSFSSPLHWSWMKFISYIHMCMVPFQ